MAVLLTFGLAAASQGAEPRARVLHVDARGGDDASDGLAASRAWRTLAKVNAAALRPGDAVLFRRGEAWRGQLVPQSGDETGCITYGAYGDGAKPLLLGSVSRSSPADWQRKEGDIWSTARAAYTETGRAEDLSRADWRVHDEGGAQVAVTRQGDVRELRCAASGTRGNHIQLYVTGLSIQAGRDYRFTFRARCSTPFGAPAIRLMRSHKPWTSYGSTRLGAPAIGAEWRELAVVFRASRTADDARITLFLGGALPAGATLGFEPGRLAEVRCNQALPLDVDVGSIIFDHGAATGVKKWTPEDLKQPGDYWYDGQHWRVLLRSEGNPADRHKSIELALRRHIINEGGRHHVTFEGLALRYGAAHGVGGGNTHHITVRGCDLSYIGGGHQLTRPGGRPVRYGNAIEFWDSAHDNLVEGCRIWEVYDAALTNQGNSPGNVQADITYRHNVIWNCEYSFEYWNRDQTSRTRNIRFEHNTCVDAGRGWAHGQRPDPNGRHLMFYHNSAQTSGFVIRHNIFAGATESCLRLGPPDWSAGLVMERNCWWQPEGALLLWLRKPHARDAFGGWREQTGLGQGSVVADPRFVDAAGRDFRLAADSAARALSAEGGQVGASR